ncbi:hypothetical protein NMY22_g10507 [Coprinellus aureogranulatus]|nr:hypothetical protein NMY22_g10507 [Coprinellus aureogranulatus]
MVVSTSIAQYEPLYQVTVVHTDLCFFLSPNWPAPYSNFSLSPGRNTPASPHLPNLASHWALLRLTKAVQSSVDTMTTPDQELPAEYRQSFSNSFGWDIRIGSGGVRGLPVPLPAFHLGSSTSDSHLFMRLLLRNSLASIHFCSSSFSSTVFGMHTSTWCLWTWFTSSPTLRAFLLTLILLAQHIRALETQDANSVTYRGSACTFDEMTGKLNFCVNATIENDREIKYELTSMIHAPEEIGWLALGFGKSMIDTNIIVLWDNDVDNTTIISHRYATSYTEPDVLANPTRVASAIEVRTSVDSWLKPKNHTTFAFLIPIQEEFLNETPLNEELVWAYSPIRPNKEHTSRITRHTEVGRLKIKFEVGQKSAPTFFAGSKSSSGHYHDGEAEPGTEHKTAVGSGVDKHAHNIHAGHELMVWGHATLLFFAFVVLLPLSVLKSRWSRTEPEPKGAWWLDTHRFLNVTLAMPVILTGVLLGVVAVWQHGAGHLDDAP